MATSPYVPVRFSFNAVVAAHGNTVRWTYTVPAGRRAVVEYAFVQIDEHTAIAGLATTGIFIAINGTVFIPEYTNNTIGFKQAEMSGELSLIAGDVLTAQSFNAVATSAVFTATASIKEYQ